MKMNFRSNRYDSKKCRGSERYFTKNCKKAMFKLKKMENYVLFNSYSYGDL